MDWIRALRAAALAGVACTLAGQGAVRIRAVTRPGLPPFEPGTQVYLLDGGRDHGLQPGELLRVSRPGVARPLGWLRITAVGTDQAQAELAQAGATYLLKGDAAAPAPLAPLPRTPAPGSALPGLPGPPAPPPVPPPWEGLLYFLPRRDDLSPAGLRKLGEWVAAWGPGGGWTLQVPLGHGLPPELQQRRAATLRTALAALGVGTVALDTQPRKAPGPYDPVWVRCLPLLAPETGPGRPPGPDGPGRPYPITSQTGRPRRTASLKAR